MFHRGELAPRPARGTTKGGGTGGITDLTYAELPEGEGTAERSAIAQTIESLPGIEVVLGEEMRAEDIGAGWVPVRIPHDWRIEQSATPDGPLFQAFAPGGVGYYRRTFSLGDYDPNVRVVLEFDGVMRDSTVWCNGFFVGDHPSGYSSFRYDITELLRYGDEGDNVVLVRVEMTNNEGWWYEGAGIYRDVWLIEHNGVHVDLDGAFVTTPSVSSERATVRVETTVHNELSRVANDVLLTTVVVDPEGAAVASKTSEIAVAANSTTDDTVELDVPSPRLWDVGEGVLYTVVSELRRGADVIDRSEAPLGMRTVEFRGADGLFVNGNPVQLKGANLHQDFAGVGIAMPDRVIAHKLELIAGMGCNAVRSAHNPSAPALLDAADRLGMFVIAENRLLSSSRVFLEDLESLVKRGRNHPSVVLWSLENEESLQGSATGVRVLERLIAKTRQLDPTRSITVGGHHNFEHEYFDKLDVVSVHYLSLRRTIDEVLAKRPSTPHIAGEEGLFPTVRGQYVDDAERGLPSAFGTEMGLFGFMSRSEQPYDNGKTWQWFADHPAVGGFVWTGIDYFGEPTPMRWPVTVSSYGAIDICGFPKDYYWLLKSFFRDGPLVHVFPHWTWPGREGERIRTWAYTNCDEVELVVNGTVVERKASVNHVVRWDDGIVYEPGTISARGLRDGDVVAEWTSTTAGAPSELSLSVEHDTVDADGCDVALVRAAVLDAEEHLCPWAEDDVLFTIDGPGELIGVGNGNPVSLEGHKGPNRRASRGLCLAIVRSVEGAEGKVTVMASADGLRGATVTFATQIRS